MLQRNEIHGGSGIKARQPPPASIQSVFLRARKERQSEREREEEKDRERELSFCIRRRAEQRRGAAASGTRGFVVEASEGGGIVVGRLEGVVRRKGFS